MSKSNRAPRRNKPNYTPLQHALLTGAPLPETIGNFEEYAVLHPFDPPLLAGGGPAFAEIWAAFHGRPMTDSDAAAVAARIKAAKP